MSVQTGDEIASYMQTKMRAPHSRPQAPNPTEATEGDESAQSLTEEAMHAGHEFLERNAIARTVTLVGGAMVTILLTAVILNEIFSAVNIGSGPFSEIGSQLQNTGVAAIGLLVVGLLVVAANRIMGIFGGSGGM